LQEGEIFVNAQILKKINADESFAKDVRFTTCNLDTPHFAFRSTKMKLINNKLAVTGRVYPEIESIPIEIISLPFGLFPLNRARHSGVLFPNSLKDQLFRNQEQKHPELRAPSWRSLWLEHEPIYV
jgi:lipopolysaccharide assembly outer membrane protein LptD (OstA)